MSHKKSEAAEVIQEALERRAPLLGYWVHFYEKGESYRMFVPRKEARSPLRAKKVVNRVLGRDIPIPTAWMRAVECRKETSK